jgi:hypothetical protein
VFHEHAVGHSDSIGGDPISGPSSSRKLAMDYHVIVFSDDQARLVLQRRWRAPNQTVTSELSGCAIAIRNREGSCSNAKLIECEYRLIESSNGSFEMIV